MNMISEDSYKISNCVESLSFSQREQDQPPTYSLTNLPSFDMVTGMQCLNWSNWFLTKAVINYQLID